MALSTLGCPETLAGTVLRRLLRDKPAVFSLAIIILFAAFSVGADFIAPFNPNQQNYGVVNAPPLTVDVQTGRLYWLGADQLGRDIVSRMLYATRVSLTIGIEADVLIAVIGVSLGLAAGYFGGRVDNLLMRLTDAVYAFPSLLIAAVVVLILGPFISAIALAIGMTSWVNMARMVRGQTLQIKQMEYVLSARSAGAGHSWIMWHHILPNILGPIIVFTTFVIPGVITAEASLAFLGVGLGTTTPTLGGTIQQDLAHILDYPHEVLAPVAVLAILTLAFTFVGDGLRDALDPRMGG